jgi:N utilization substance protein B
MGLRRIARECALQMLYQYDVGKHAPDEIGRTFWQMNEQPARVQEFAAELFEGSIARIEELDRLIQKHARHWRLGRMAAVDRNILRLAVFELISDHPTPGTVVINEALEIAKKYSTGESAQFVNGILDSIKNELRESESTTQVNSD